MIKKGAELIAGWLIRREAISMEEKDLYVFACCSFFMTFVPLVLAILIGKIMGNVASGIEIIIPFMIIRKFCGGFHAKKAWICLSCSTLILSICIYISSRINCGYGLLCITFLFSLSLIKKSPIDCENRVLDEKERRLYKRVTAFLVSLCIFISILCFCFGNGTVAKNLALGIILAGLLQLPCL